MSNFTYKLRIIFAIFISLSIFNLNQTVLASDCSELVWYGDYEIRNIADLHTLAGYTTVMGDLLITHSDLTSLDGLGCLTSVAGDLTISFNLSLKSLEGLEHLQYLGGQFYLQLNPHLASLQGLGNLKSIESSLVIIENQELCTGAAEAFADQLIDAGCICEDIMIHDNKDC